MKKKLRRQQPRRSLLETFLQLCSMTTPEGCEAYCWHLLPKGKDIDWYIDQNNNVHIYVYTKDEDGRLRDSRIMWSCHLDTADYHPEHVTFLRSVDKAGDEIIETDGKTLLGADCKIGAAIMIKMIEARIPGWYAFFAGEESGRVGSDALARRLAEKMKSEEVSLPDICIAFDRYGTDEIITHQMGRRTCSQTFALALASIFNRREEFLYKPSDRGSYTDSYSFCGLIPECTNIAVGYQSQHTHYEEQNITHAEKLLATILEHRALFEMLPADRDPGVVEEKSRSYWYAGVRDDVNQSYGNSHSPMHNTGGKGSDPTKAGGSDTTEPKAQQSGTVGTQAAGSGTTSGSGSGTSDGTGGRMGVGCSQPWGKAKKKLTKAEKKRLKKQRRAERKAKQRSSASTTSPSDSSESNSKMSSSSQKPTPDSNSGSEKPERKGEDQTDRYPFRCKTAQEVVMTRPAKPYQGYLGCVRRAEISTASSESKGIPDWMKDDYGETEAFSHGGWSTGGCFPRRSDGYDDTFDDRSLYTIGDMDLEEHLFDEQVMAYEKGELSDQEEEEFLVEYLKRGGNRGLTTPHRHGQVVLWYECMNCEAVIKGVGWRNQDDPVRCSDCGDLVERKMLKYDADVKLYLPVNGDITDAIPPHLIP